MFGGIGVKRSQELRAAGEDYCLLSAGKDGENNSNGGRFILEKGRTPGT